MYKNFQILKAGDNRILRYSINGYIKLGQYMEVRNGYVSIPVDGKGFWTIGTTRGKHGEFCIINGVHFSVNRAGFAYAKAGTEKAEKLVRAIQYLYEEMERLEEQKEEIKRKNQLMKGQTSH